MSTWQFTSEMITGSLLKNNKEGYKRTKGDLIIINDTLKNIARNNPSLRLAVKELNESMDLAIKLVDMKNSETERWLNELKVK